MTQSATPPGNRRRFLRFIVIFPAVRDPHSTSLLNIVKLQLLFTRFLQPLGVMHTILPIRVKNLGAVVRRIALFDKFALVGTVAAEHEKFGLAQLVCMGGFFLLGEAPPSDVELGVGPRAQRRGARRRDAGGRPRLVRNGLLLNCMMLLNGLMLLLSQTFHEHVLGRGDFGLPIYCILAECLSNTAWDGPRYPRLLVVSKDYSPRRLAEPRAFRLKRLFRLSLKGKRHFYSLYK